MFTLKHSPCYQNNNQVIGIHHHLGGHKVAFFIPEVDNSLSWARRLSPLVHPLPGYMITANKEYWHNMVYFLCNCTFTHTKYVSKNMKLQILSEPNETKQDSLSYIQETMAP